MHECIKSRDLVGAMLYWQLQCSDANTHPSDRLAMTCPNILHRRQLVGTALRRYIKHDNELVQHAARWLFDPAHAHPRSELALQVAEMLGTASEVHATLAAAVELIHASLYLHYHAALSRSMYP
jgi:hypothetical protein